MPLLQGLLPVYINLETGMGNSNQVAIGALSDSYYEYLLKVWILKGRSDDMYRFMWVRAMDEMLERLVGTSSDGLLYVGDLNGCRPSAPIPNMNRVMMLPSLRCCLHDHYCCSRKVTPTCTLCCTMLLATNVSCK